jgi:hypothetical protein
MGRGLDGFFLPSWKRGTRRPEGGEWLLVQFSRPVEGLGLSPVSGGFGEGETPLPIPNRAVKPLSADGTWPARAWESRTPPVYFNAIEPPKGGSTSLRALPRPCTRGRGDAPPRAAHRS